MRIPSDLTVTDYLQRLQAWSEIASAAGIAPAAVVEMAQSFAAAVTVPVCGKAVQRIGSDGFEPDGFMLRRGRFRFAARASLKAARVELWLPMHHAGSVDVTVACGDATITEAGMPGTLCIIELTLAMPEGAQSTFTIELSASFQPSSLSTDSPDYRRLGCIVNAVEFS